MRENLISSCLSCSIGGNHLTKGSCGD